MDTSSNDEKMMSALKAAGIVIPQDPELRDTVSKELSKRGLSPSYLLVASFTNYAVIVRESESTHRRQSDS